ncbi:MAG: hypothetical protein AAFV33_24220 [Chloroflexota bacterium]
MKATFDWNVICKACETEFEAEIPVDGMPDDNSDYEQDHCWVCDQCGYDQCTHFNWVYIWEDGLYTDTSN